MNFLIGPGRNELCVQTTKAFSGPQLLGSQQKVFQVENLVYRSIS